MFFNKGAETPLDYPLLAIPENSGNSRLVNPAVGDSHGLSAPTMPHELGFESELNEVLEVRLMVSQGIYPADFMARHHPRESFNPVMVPEPLAREGLTIENPQAMANVVHMDSPIDMPLAVLAWLLSEGAQRKKPTSEHVDFLGHVPHVVEDVADAVKRNLHKAFEAKYWFGRPRPEEVLHQFTDISPELFTAYPEGCPCHPAYPAGHGAAAGAVRIFKKLFHLTEAQWRVCVDTAYHWSMYRTFAGVHYANDNTAGLAIGGLRLQ